MKTGHFCYLRVTYDRSDGTDHQSHGNGSGLFSVPLLIAPLIALSLLTWWLAGRVHDGLPTAKRRQHGVVVAEFERRFSEQFHDFSRQIAQWGEQNLRGRPSSPPIEEAGWYVICDGTGRWYYPAGYASLPDGGPPALVLRTR